MTRLTAQELDAIRKRAEKATEGPWVWEDEKAQRESDMPVLAGAIYNVMNFGNCETYYPTEGTPPSEDDAEFIAKARTDIPKLLAEVEALRSGIRTAIDGTSCDDTYDYLNRLLDGVDPLNLPYRIGGDA